MNLVCNRGRIFIRIIQIWYRQIMFSKLVFQNNFTIILIYPFVEIIGAYIKTTCFREETAEYIFIYNMNVSLYWHICNNINISCIHIWMILCILTHLKFITLLMIYLLNFYLKACFQLGRKMGTSKNLTEEQSSFSYLEEK